MNMFKSYISSLKLAEPTKVVHLRNTDLLEPILDKSPKKMINYLNKNVSLAQRFQLNKTISKYLEFVNRMEDREIMLVYAREVKDELTKKQQEKTCEIKDMIEDKTMKTKAELFVALNELYKNVEYRAYIINYLLLNFSVRNMDLDLILTKTKKGMSPDKNYLLIRKSKIVFIRNNYKTVKLYGTKEYVITDKKFINSVYNILPDETLLKTNNIGREVRKYTIDGLSESQLNKIMVYDLGVNELEHISQSRGTSLKVLTEAYNPCKTL